jgi:hypothetical protein
MCFCRVPRRLEWTESVRTRNSYTESPARVGVLALVLVQLLRLILVHMPHIIKLLFFQLRVARLDGYDAISVWAKDSAMTMLEKPRTRAGNEWD